MARSVGLRLERARVRKGREGAGRDGGADAAKGAGDVEGRDAEGGQRDSGAGGLPAELLLAHAGEDVQVSRLVLREDQVQGTIIDGLRAMGYRVWCTTIRGARRGSGQDKGIPDLLVGRKEWGPVRMPLEVKGPKTRLSAEQQGDVDDGVLYVARSWDDALEAVALFESKYGFKQIAWRVS